MRPDEIGNKIVEDIVNENNKEVYLVAGLINATGKVLHWRTRAEIKLGDYAIVENMNDYDLVKIVGTVITTEKYIKHISNSVITKKVVKILKRNEVRGD